MSDKKYNYLYKITNLINGKFYYGIHSTNRLDDGYMGSGTELNIAYCEEGMENFKKEIVAFYDSRENLINAEKEMVTEELVLNPMCYNNTTGGTKFGSTNIGMVSVKDEHDNYFLVSVNDPRYLSGELVSVSSGMVVVRDDNGKTMQVPVDDPRYLSGELKHSTCGCVVVMDKEGNTMQVSVNDPRYLSGELVSILKGYAMVRDENGKVIRIRTDSPDYKKYKHMNKGKVIAKDKFGNPVSVSKDDPRLTTGELVGITKGEITVYDKSGNKIKVKKGDPRFESGELHGYRKNLVTVVDKDGNRMSVRNDDPRFLSGELVSTNSGRTSINKDGVEKHVYKDELQKYLDDGWKTGRLYRKRNRNRNWSEGRREEQKTRVYLKPDETGV